MLALYPVLFIQTGGSIDKRYPVKPGSYGFEIEGPASFQILKKFEPSIHHSQAIVLKKDSLDITDEDRKKIYGEIVHAPQKHIVITHGSDTAKKTAEYIAKRIPEDPAMADRIVVITCSLLPYSDKNSDAEFNLGATIGALEFLKPGVYICLYGRIHPWEQFEKRSQF